MYLVVKITIIWYNYNGEKIENIIKIHLNEKSDYQNKFNEEILSYDLSNYILEEARSVLSH